MSVGTIRLDELYVFVIYFGLFLLVLDFITIFLPCCCNELEIYVIQMHLKYYKCS